MTTLAFNQGAQVCQSFMGRPKIHRPKDPGSHLGPMFREVVGSLIKMMKHFESFWLNVKYSRPTSIYGFGLGEVEMPPKVDVDTDVLFQKFHDGFNQCKGIWKEVLAEDLGARERDYRTILTFSHVFTFQVTSLNQMQLQGGPKK